MSFILPGMIGVLSSRVFSNAYSIYCDGSDYGDPNVDFKTVFQSDFTVSCWLKYDVTSTTQMIFAADSQVGGYNNRINLYRVSTGTRMFCSFEGTATTNLEWAHNPGTGWNHYMFVVRQNGSAVEQEIFANGVTRANNSTASVTMSDYGTSTQVADPYVGARNTGDASNTPQLHFDGYIDEFAIFPSDQTANASAIYNSGEPKDLSEYSPIAYWRMGDNDGGAGTTVTDQGSGSNNLTLTSSIINTQVP